MVIFMLNHFDDRIVLLINDHQILDGFSVNKVEDKIEVWAEQQTVNRQEYYLSQQAGVKIDVVFIVNAIDYSGQTAIEYRDAIYDVVRAYQKELDRIELSCSRRQ